MQVKWQHISAATPSPPRLNARSGQVLTREAYGDALELTEVIYKLCHHIGGLGVLKLHGPHPLESLIWPPVIPSNPSQPRRRAAARAPSRGHSR